MIRADNLWKKFGRHEALHGLSFSVPEGSAYALIGANGAGKTTTIRILMNILEAERGKATVLGVDSSRLSPSELAQIGYVSENQDMPARLAVAEYLDYLGPFYPTWDQALEASISGQLRLPASRRIGDLSHGMRMKMALACALPFRPKLLILDEPFSGLDPLVRDEFMEGILQQAGEMTVLISSHELNEIDGVATHVGFLDEGKLLFEESMSDLTARFRGSSCDAGSGGFSARPRPEGMAECPHVGQCADVRGQPVLGGSAQRRNRIVERVRNVDTQPMALRSIFTALARSAKQVSARHEEDARKG